MFVTSTDIAIDDKDVSSRFLLIEPIPFRRFAELKYRSISIRSVLSRDTVLRSFLTVCLSLNGRPSFGTDTDSIILTELDVSPCAVDLINKDSFWIEPVSVLVRF